MMPASPPRRALAFEQNPPWSIPLRFFLSAPLFAALAAGLLAWQGDTMLLSRWSPRTLALTHLLVLGCLSMTMLGALLQMLPVVAGMAVPRVGQIGALVHIGTACGALLLGAAFWRQQPLLFQGALLLLGGSFLLFLSACTVAMWQPPPQGAGAVVAGVRLSLTALILTVALGCLLAAAFAWPERLQLPLQRITDTHAMWGLLGWVGLLVIAFAYQVVPMFMLTEPYPRWLTEHLGGALFILMAAASVSTEFTGGGRLFHQACLLLIGLAYAIFAAATLMLLARRKRPQRDATSCYWGTAMCSVIAASVLALWPAPADNARPLAIGALMIAGFALSVINGMLYKIVPFLTWHHLQQARERGAPKPPAVSQFIPQHRAVWQYVLHLLGLLLLLGACYQPRLSHIAGTVMCIACLALSANLGCATMKR
ncbi:permease [Duganella radicis]|uniref:Permease n=1 Tax=Duganella radicis TaxID=551988 RepID=A0A6L6PRN5_9BURK|nr:permease [Duganella radicis]MTV41297.1 permease [Duganella radicis]